MTARIHPEKVESPLRERVAEPCQPVKETLLNRRLKHQMAARFQNPVGFVQKAFGMRQVLYK